MRMRVRQEYEYTNKIFGYLLIKMNETQNKWYKKHNMCIWASYNNIANNRRFKYWRP